MASGVKGTGLLQLISNPPPKPAPADSSGEGDFKAQLQRHQSPKSSSDVKSTNPDNPPRSTEKPGTISKTSQKDQPASQKSEPTPEDQKSDPSDKTTTSTPAAQSQKSSSATEEETAPDTPDKKATPTDATTAQQALAQTAAAPPAAPPPTASASPDTATQTDAPATDTKKGVENTATPPEAAVKQAVQKNQSAVNAAAATVASDPSNTPTAAGTEAVAAGATSSQPPPSSQATPPAKKPASETSPQPALQALAIQPESGDKVNKVAGKLPNGQNAADGTAEAAQASADVAASDIAAQSAGDQTDLHKAKLGDGSETQSNFDTLLTAAGPKTAPSSAPLTASPPTSAQRPEAQFAEANHPSIVSSIRGQLLPGGGSMQLRLDPPELGAMQVTVQMHDGVMTASFQTSSDEATRMLSHSLNQLKTALESQGVSVDKLQVRQQTFKDSHNQDSSQQHQQQAQDNPARQQQQRRDLMRRMWAKLALGDEPLDITG
jgi:flagellar hook-length control protein FliK